MKISSASFCVTLLLACPFIYSMNTLYPEQQNDSNMLIDNYIIYSSRSPQYYSAEPIRFNHQARKQITRQLKRASTLDNIQDKITALNKLNVKLLSFQKIITAEKDKQWLNEQLQKIETLMQDCSYESELKFEVAFTLPKGNDSQEDSPALSKTVVLEKDFFTRAHTIAQEEEQLIKKKREVEQSKEAYKQYLIKKQEDITRKELEAQQILTTTQQKIETFKELRREMQLRIDAVEVIENYTPHCVTQPTNLVPNTENLVVDSETSQYCDEPEDSIKLGISLVDKKQTSTPRSQLSHSCNIQ